MFKLFLELLDIDINVLFSGCQHLPLCSPIFLIFKLFLLTIKQWAIMGTTNHINLRRSRWIIKITKRVLFCIWLKLNIFRYFICFIRLNIINNRPRIIYTLVHIWWSSRRRNRNNWIFDWNIFTSLIDYLIIMNWILGSFHVCKFQMILGIDTL